MKLKETSRLNHQFNDHKILVLKVLLFFTFIVGLVFFSINFSLGYTVLASVELLAAIISLILWFYISKAIPAHLFSMMVADLDHYKKINDICGHNVGDKLIKKFADIMEKYSGPDGTCFRISGEEFCIISKTEITLYFQIAENIRQATQNINIDNKIESMNMTTSTGITSSNEQFCDMSELLKRADRKL